MINMLGIEVRRCFERRLVRWLIVIALVGCVIISAVVRRQAGQAGEPEFRFTEMWVAGGDSILGVAGMFLLIGGVFGGASMIGAEWRAGTFVTLLTWEPRRALVAGAKLVACGVVAAAVAVVLQLVYCAAFLPAAFGPGTMAGVDAEWLRLLGGGVLRIAALTGFAAALMASIAMIGRNTAAAMGVAFAYLMVVENIVHAWKPWAARFLIGPNGAIFATGGQLETEEFTRSTLAAGLTLAGYATAVALLAVATFWRRDLASAS